MPLLVLVLVAVGVATAVAFATWHYPTPMASPTPSLAAAKAMGRELAHHSRLRRTVTSRLSPEAVTGLALTVALGAVLLGGVVLGALAYLVRTNSQLVDLDASVAQWGADHAGPFTERALNAITQLGATWLVFVLAIVVALVGYRRRPNRWLPVFLLTVLVGQLLLTNGIKDLFDRVRPTLNPITETLGPSFPSGHTATAAAFYAAAALILVETPARMAAHSWPVLQRVSPSPWAARAFSSVCIGSLTPSRDSSSAGPGSQPAALRSVDVASSASALRPRRQCTRRMRRSRGSWRSEFLETDERIGDAVFIEYRVKRR